VTEAQGPLSDVRILALEQFGAGPLGSMLLADLGAEVVKIEDRASGGDVGRSVPPFAQSHDSLYFQTFNRSKRSICLDLHTAEGYGVFLDLVEESDAVYSNLRGDVPEKLRIKYEHLRSRNPAIVCCSLSGYGMSGTHVGDPAYDYILQATAGWMSLTGEPDGAPTKSGLSLVDYTSGLVAALTLVSAIHAARRDSTGTDCDLSLYDVGIAMLTYPATWHLTAGYTVGRTSHSAHPSLVPFQAFATQDGWIVVGVAKEKFWSRLVRAIGRPDLEQDPRFADFAARKANAPILISQLNTVFKTRSSDHWVTLLRANGIPCGRVNTVAEALASPECSERRMIATFDHPTFGQIMTPGTPIKIGSHHPKYRKAPDLGEDTEAVLQRILGYSPDKIERLARLGAFGRTG
jgi:crotonobetainyl-CoA:carnitine CoA-transferase CaiB-like acyl-CoA transferase